MGHLKMWRCFRSQARRLEGGEGRIILPRSWVSALPGGPANSLPGMYARCSVSYMLLWLKLSRKKGHLRQYLPKFQMRTLRASVTKGPPRATSELAAARLLPPCPGAIPACWTCPLSQCPSWGICHRVKMKFSFCVLIYETGRG